MTRMKWRKASTADGVVTLTDPSGRIVIEKHTHHYGPWLIKDTWLDERAGETEVSEAEAKRLAEEYLDAMPSAASRPLVASQTPAPPAEPPLPMRVAPPVDSDVHSDLELAKALRLLGLAATPRNRAAIRALADVLREHP